MAAKKQPKATTARSGGKSGFNLSPASNGGRPLGNTARNGARGPQSKPASVRGGSS
jgi:hypothetical protein